MHFLTFVTTKAENGDQAKGRANAFMEEKMLERETALHEIEDVEEGDESDFAPDPFGWDWWVIGGRWSGILLQVNKWYQDFLEMDSRMMSERGLGYHFIGGSEENADKQEEVYKALDEEWRRVAPDWLKGEIQPFRRDQYKNDGYADDAMVIDDSLYSKFLEKFEGANMTNSDYHLLHVDIDGDDVSREFIGKKYIVAVDYHW